LGAQVVAVGVVGNAIVVCVAVVDEDNLAGVCVVAGYVFAGFADAGDTGGNRAEQDGVVAVASGRVLRGVDIEFRAFVLRAGEFPGSLGDDFDVEALVDLRYVVVVGRNEQFRRARSLC